MLRCLIVESEPRRAREERRDSVGRTSGENYADVLKTLAPLCTSDEIRPSDSGSTLPSRATLDSYDAVFMTGSPLHLYEETPETRRHVELMRAIFTSGTPAFGSCAGLQVATVAAGGTVRPNRRGREAAFARRVTTTEAGREHPLHRGRPDAFDAPTIHTDEVEALPEGATLLATNRVTQVQGAEIKVGPGIFWGVQYHPELSLAEIASALRRQAHDLVEEGFARGPEGIEAHAGSWMSSTTRPSAATSPGVSESTSR